MVRHFIKANGTVYSLNDNNNIITPSVSTPPIRNEFLLDGMADLTPLFQPSSKVLLEMDEVEAIGTGMEFNKVVSPVDFERMITGATVI